MSWDEFAEFYGMDPEVPPPPRVGSPHAKPIPRPILMKVLNRRRRLVMLERARGPVAQRVSEQLLLNKALDEFCAWAEEHAPELFYTDKEM